MPSGWTKQLDKKDAAPTTRSAHATEAIEPDARHAVEALSNERMEMFVPVEPKRRLEDLVAPSGVQGQITAALNSIRHHQVLYEEWGLKEVDPRGARAVINLFGPPGTGKSFCAEAIAHHLGRPLISVNYAEIESKYVGETPKNIGAAFRRAHETGAVLFFDEADSVLGKRLTQVTQSADHGVNVSRSVMLLQLDAFEGVVIFATNLARNYDGAFVRRILAHIEFTLPDLDCRRRLWSKLLPSKLPLGPNVEPEWLARESAGLAGGHMVNVVIQAASRAVGREGQERRVTRDDLIAEIENVRQAIAQVGSAPERKATVHEEEVPVERLPPEVQHEFTKRTNEEHPATSTSTPAA